MFSPLVAVVSIALATDPGSQSAGAAANSTDRQVIPSVQEPAEGETIRVGGDREARTTQNDKGWFLSGSCVINTPLPEGYPAPTPPGAIEVKRYPLVRRAEVSGTMTPDIGMNIAFFPLFNHIKGRDIAMTSPVEMNYSRIDRNPPEGGDVVPETWTMSFLYRTPELGPTGVDPKRTQVKIVDVAPVTVVSIGIRGSYAFSRVRKEWAVLEQWLSEHPEWDAAGEPRALYYNGPEVRSSEKWAEVQIPIVRSTKSATPAASAAVTPAKETPRQDERAK